MASDQIRTRRIPLPRVVELLHSSVLAAMGYDEPTRTLTLRFRDSGETYHYLDVPPDVWQAFQAAPSKGTFLNDTFKPLNFAFKRHHR